MNKMYCQIDFKDIKSKDTKYEITKLMVIIFVSSFQKYVFLINHIIHIIIIMVY